MEEINGIKFIPIAVLDDDGERQWGAILESGEIRWGDSCSNCGAPLDYFRRCSVNCDVDVPCNCD